MSDKQNRILLVEDSESLAVVYKQYLIHEGYNVTHTVNGQNAISLLASESFDVILLDLELPDINGMDVLRVIHENNTPSSIVIITAHGSIDRAVDAMRYGAFDFISKPFDSSRLAITVKNALQHYELSKIVSSYEKNFERESYYSFIGKSLEMQAVYRMIDSAAPSNATVFIKGESGTGKELCAEAIHNESKRAEKSFVAINCAAIPKDLIESELFGHIKGSFTGANKDRQGAASRADGGTLFLDEICELDYDLQSKLLRFIQLGTFNKVGSDKLETVDIRIVCATNRDPLNEVKEGRFREDLYYRLHVIPIELPPLRNRGNDILLLADFFLNKFSHDENKKFTGFDDKAQSLIAKYEWPGNIRELQNTIHNIVVLNDSDNVTSKMLPDLINVPTADINDNTYSISTRQDDPTPFIQDNEINPLWLVEKNTIQAAIDKCNGNIQKAAVLLEVSASTIYRKLQNWEDKKSAS